MASPFAYSVATAPSALPSETANSTAFSSTDAESTPVKRINGWLRQIGIVGSPNQW